MRRLKLKISYLLILIIMMMIPMEINAVTKEVREKEILKIGIYENEPLSYLDKDNNPTGFVVEIIDYICKKEGYIPKYEYLSLDQGLNKLKKNELDMELVIAFSNERDKYFKFTNEPLLVNWAEMYVSKKSKLQNILDFEGKKIGVIRQDIHYVGEGGIKNNFEKFGVKSEFVEFDSPEKMFEEVERGNIDGAFLNRLYGIRNMDKYNMKSTSIIMNPIELKIALRKDLDEDVKTNLDFWLKVLKTKENSFYYEKMDYYLSGIKGISISNIVKKIIIIGGLSIFILVGIVILTKRKIHEKTMELNVLNSELKESYENLEIYNEELIALNDEIEESYRETRIAKSKLEELIRVIKDLGNQSIDDESGFVFKVLNTSLSFIDEADFGIAILIKGEDISLVKCVGCLVEKERLNFDKQKYLNLKNGSKKIFISKENPSDYIENMKKEDFEDIKESMVIPLSVESELLGLIILSIKKDSNYNFCDSSQEIMESFKSIVETFLSLKDYHERKDDIQKEIILAMTGILEIHDEYTKGHSENVAKTAVEIGQKLGFSKQELTELYWTGMVHDIGKILISREILNKPSKLTESEFGMIKKHPEYGYKALSNSNSLKKISKNILMHHERWDGNGYPKKLKTDEISRASSIIAIADTWDAMISDRSYRKGMDKEDAIREIKNGRGSQFCPEVVDVFLDMIE